MQCDCEDIYCEQAGRHHVGLCNGTPVAKVSCFGQVENLCQPCLEHLQTEYREDTAVVILERF